MNRRELLCLAAAAPWTSVSRSRAKEATNTAGDNTARALIDRVLLTTEELTEGVCLVEIGLNKTLLRMYQNRILIKDGEMLFGDAMLLNAVAKRFQSSEAELTDAILMRGLAFSDLLTYGTGSRAEILGTGNMEAVDFLGGEINADIQNYFSRIFYMTKQFLDVFDLDPVSGIVLSGVFTQVRGVVELGEQICHLVVRIARAE